MKTTLQFGITGFILLYFFCSIGSGTWNVMQFTDICTYLFAAGTFGCIGIGLLTHVLFVKEEDIWENEKRKYYNNKY